jgi:hypothetical protein
LRPLTVAVVRLIVQHDDALQAHQVGHDPLHHLPFGFQRVQLRTAALEQGTRALGEVDPLAQLEGVIVGQHDLRPVDVREHVAGDQLAALVVAVGVIGRHHAQPVANRAGRDDEEAAREGLAVRVADGVDRLPGNQHRHDRRLAGAGRQFQRETQQFRVGLLVRPLDVLPEFVTPLAHLGRNFDKPDDRLDSLNLTEERTDAMERMVPPVPEQARRLGRDLPVVRVRELSPSLNVSTDFVDDRGGIVLLLGGRYAVPAA